MGKARVFGLAATLVLLVSGSASAAYISLYSNFGAGWWDGDGYYVSGPGGTVPNSVVAMPFTSTGTGQLDYVKLALSHISTANAHLSLYLASDADGEPGAIIETLTSLSLPSDYGYLWPDGVRRGGMVAFSSESHTLLSAGTTYWVVAAQPTPGVDLVWHCTYLPYDYRSDVAGNYLGSPTGPWNLGSNYIMSAFAVEGHTIPDSASTLFLFGMALAGLGALRRRAG